MQKREQLYEGKAKILYTTDDPDLLVMYFKDDATAFNKKKVGQWDGKGMVNCRISTVMLGALARAGVESHLVEKLSDREQLVRRVHIIPVEVVVRNVVAGSLARRLGMPEGRRLSKPFVEWYYKSDSLDDPMILDQWILEFGWATAAELELMRSSALEVNRVVGGFFEGLDIDLIDFKIEFGRDSSGRVLLADEVTPDGSRLWERGTGRKLDKDRFRYDLGDVQGTYEELLRRVEAAS